MPRVDLTPEEIQLIGELINKVPVSGVQTMAQIVGLSAKLGQAMKQNGLAAQPEEKPASPEVPVPGANPTPRRRKPKTSGQN